MEKYSIKDLEILSGINAHTIRVWERRYSFINPERTETNRRLYGDDQLRMIINIAILKRNGFKISRIATLTGDEIDEKVSFISRELFNKDTQTDALVVATLSHDESEINRILVRSVMEKGFEFTISGLIFPFLRRIGIMWQTGSAGIATEHFATNIIRQKIISAIDSLPLEKSAGSKKVLLFLPENEYHEIPLLCYNYFIRKWGHNTLYLGANTPFESAVAASTSWNPDIVVTYVLSPSRQIDPERISEELTTKFKGKKILAGGILRLSFSGSGSDMKSGSGSFEELKSILS